jgi:hypothetical protein
MASPDPTSVGNATWTDNSTGITLASAKTLTIDNCSDRAWTAFSANVSSTTSTTSLRKIGSTRYSVSIASGFTTGKVCYYTLPSTLNLSSYQQVSLWIHASAAIVVGVLQLRLCSDSTGDTPVHTIPLDNVTSNTFRTRVWDNLAALSSGINSISLYALTDPGTIVVTLQNIIACLAPTTTGCLTHQTLIGKNTASEGEWYPISTIDAQQ